MERTDPGVVDGTPAVAHAVLFLSHSGVDREAARELKRRLEASVSGREAGLRVWLDVEGDLVPGPSGWQEQIEEAIDQTCTAFAIYVGSKGVVNWVDNEVRLGLSRATRDRIPFVPILSHGIGSAALPPFARLYEAVRDPLNDANELARLVAGVLQTGTPPVIVADPFVGLRAMTEEDALLFYGRDQELKELEGKLARSRFVAVVADSGSGKSSLVRAGLIPHYRGGVFADRRSREPDARIWHVVVMRPGTSPLDGLRLAVTTAAEQRGLSVGDKNDLRNALDFDIEPQTAYALQCNLPAETTETLLVVDQFEELFTQTPEPQRKLFIDWLLRLVAPGARPSVRVVITMRSDHFNLCSSHEALSALLSREEAVLRLKSVTPGGLADIVREPLRLAGRTDQGEQEAVIRQIRQQVSDRAGDLALVQMALYEAWSRRRQHNDDLVESLVAVGGVAGALANAAEEVRTKRLDASEQQLLEAVLVRLVVLGETAGATRRTARLKEFGSTDNPKRLLIDKLADERYGRLLLTGSDTVEICHEQLVTQWPWWQTWINVQALDMRRLARLMAKAPDWLEALPDQRASFLATGADLQIFANLATAHPDWLSDTEQAFVADSRRQDEDHIRQEKEARETERRLREEAEDNARQARLNAEKAIYNARSARRLLRSALLLSILLAIAALGIGLALLVANHERGRADAESKRALENETRALTALSNNALTQGRAKDAATLALAAWPRNNTDTKRPQLKSTLTALSAALETPSFFVRKYQDEAPILGVLLTSDGTRALSWSADKTLRLWNLATGQQIGLAMQHDDAVYGALLMPDGARVLSWSADKTLRLWNLTTGQQIGPAMQHDDAVYGALLMPDGARVLSWSADKTLRLWNLTTGQQIGPAMQHDDAVYGALLMPDGARVLSWSADKTLRLWNLTTGQQIGPAMQHDDAVYGALLMPDGARVLSWSADKTLRLWDLATGQQIGSSMQHDGPVRGAVITEGATRALSWSADSTLRLWDLASGEQIGPAMRHDGAISGAVLMKDQGRALTWSDDNTLRLWNLATGEQIGPSMQHDDSVDGVLLSKDGTHALSWSFDNTMRLWDLVTDKQILPAMRHDGEIYGTLVMKDNMRALSWSADNSLRLWNLATGQQIGPAMQHDGAVMGVVLTKDDGRALSWSGDDTLRVWDLATGQQIGPAMQHKYAVKGALLTRDGNRALSWWSDDYDGSLQLWDLATGQQIGPAIPSGPVNGALLMNDETRVLSWSDDHTLRLWDLATGQQLGPAMPHDGVVNGASLTSDGARALSWSFDNTLRLWDLRTGQQIGPAMWHQGTVSGALLAKDGRRALSWSGDVTLPGDNTLRLWDLATGQQIGPAMQHNGAVNGAVLTPDGSRALSWSDDKTLRLWDLATGKSIGPAMQHDGSVKGALLTSDGTRALSWWSGDYDGSLQLWDLSTGQHIGPAIPSGAADGAILTNDETRVLSWSNDNTLRVWGVDWPKAPSLVQMACDLLSAEISEPYRSRYRIQIPDPICKKGTSLPLPDWTTMEP
ncbi:TIR domain-containing protein [Rhizobium ruizarguesonis]|uniref:nSTAND1 domain-containing NTPase n=2 Tax=Rhizobium ruizarguesonis TaxID=2081791 RepID=UPI0010303F33|nr:TIR domain-containing protein [Rhizobium ruizarguesonis]TBB38567.1 TIR domain-containing protein [Rhizobium ruizarguesonis]